MHQVSSENQHDEMEVDRNYRNYYSHEEFQELVQKYSDLEDEKQKISNELNECSRKIDNYKVELDRKEDQVNEISEKCEQSLNTLQKLYQDELNEKNNLKDQLENLSTENEKFKKVQSDYTAICDENEKLKVQLESLSTENERLKKAQIDYDNEYNSLNEQLSSLRKENKILRNRQKNDSNEISKIKADYDDINDKLKIYLDNDIKNNKNPSVYKENSDLKVRVKDLKKSLQTLNSDKEKLTNRVKESDDKLEKILAENKLLKDKISALSKIEDYSAIRTENDRLKDKLKQFEDKQVKDKNGKISKFQNKSNEIESIEQLQKEEYIKEISDLNSSLQKRGKEIQDLIEKNNRLKKEASQYQSVLGTVTSYRMDDDDKNHSVQLKKDIEDLQNKLKNYVTTLKVDCEIDFNMVNSLMEKYNIKTKVTPEKPNKPLIKAVLQYHIIKKITRDFREYLKQNSKGSIMHLEAEIARKAKDLEIKLALFSKTRSGTDTTTQSASIKIRQEVNIALGNRGFSDVSNGGTQHAYIASKKTELNEEMEKYRKIKDENKKNYVEKSAADLIREFIRIIHFRLKVQEPSAQIRWINIDSNIDPSIMEGSWDKDDIDNLEAEVCYFPMIGRDLDDVEKRKIYTHAQVFVKRKKSFVKGLSSYWSKKSKVILEPESDDDSHNGVD